MSNFLKTYLGIIVLALVLLFVVGCSSDKVTVFHNNDRVTELERRANLNDQLNVLQNQRLDALEAALAAETAARESADSDLAVLLEAEREAREAGDEQNAKKLKKAILAQKMVNFFVQGQIACIVEKLKNLSEDVRDLTEQVSDLSESVDALEDSVAALDERLDNLADEMLTADQVQNMIEQAVADLELVTEINITNNFGLTLVKNVTEINNYYEITNSLTVAQLDDGSVQIGDQCLFLDVIKSGNSNKSTVKDVELVLDECED